MFESQSCCLCTNPAALNHLMVFTKPELCLIHECWCFRHKNTKICRFKNKNKVSNRRWSYLWGCPVFHSYALKKTVWSVLFERQAALFAAGEHNLPLVLSNLHFPWCLREVDVSSCFLSEGIYHSSVLSGLHPFIFNGGRGNVGFSCPHLCWPWKQMRQWSSESL